MPSMKAIKRRIVSVNNTRQIMKAMDLVAASKLQKNKQKLEAIKGMLGEAKSFLENGISLENTDNNVYFEEREVKNVVYVVITGDRGLCGSYNSNISKEVFEHMKKHGKNVKVIPIGIKGKDFLVRRKKEIIDYSRFIDKHELKKYTAVSESTPFSLAEHVARYLHDLYVSENMSERIDEVYVAYSQYESILTHVPCVMKVLPFSNDIRQENKKVNKNTIYEPDPITYLKKSLPVYLSMFIYGAMVEASVCEQAARMTSMDAAAHNAEEIIEDLTLDYNRKRQGIITQEINEIVSGANAL